MTTSFLRAAPALQSAGYIVPLDRAMHLELAGGKAHNLYRVQELGLSVPRGFVVTTRAFEDHLEENYLAAKIHALSQQQNRQPSSQRQLATRIHDLIVNTELSPALREMLEPAAEELLSLGPVVVRSSAIGEDSARASFAGQLDSFLHVRTFAELEKALLACWASCWSERAITYRAAQGMEVRGMGVVVQTQVDALAAGVLFTRTAEGTILVEHTPGLGDALVAGAINPGRFVLPRSGNGFLVLCEGERPITSVEKVLFSRSTLTELRRAAAMLEEGLGGPQDVEWAIDHSGLLYIVQSRPITAIPIVSAPQPGGSPIRWSDANVNENFPAPISPFLYSIASAGYAHYFRNLARAFGLSKTRIAAMDDALRHIIGVHGARMYYNLTNIHTVLRLAPFGDALVTAFNSFVGAGGSFGTAKKKTGQVREVFELAVIAVKVTWLYLFLERRVASFERLVDDFAERTEPNRLAALSLRDLRLLLNDLMDIRCHRWTNASLADAASMVCYAMLRRLVEQANDGKVGTLHNTLLKAIPELVSGRPVQELWELSRAVRADAALCKLFESDSESVVNQITVNPTFADFRAQFEEYLQRWGFRCSAELMLTAPSFQEEPALLVDIIRAYARRDCESPAAALSRQLVEREQETKSLLRRLRWDRAAVLRIVLRWTQAAIAFRERARLKQALLYSRCRRLALALGDQLVTRGRLAEREDVFLLTVQEVDELTAGRAMFPHQVQELTAMRKRAHDQLAATQPLNDFTLPEGEYLPLEGELQVGDVTPDHSGPHTLQGVGACGGRVAGRAVVLHDASEAGVLTGEDILVTRQTDPGWAPVFFLIKGLVIERGGMLSHGAIVAREFGIPCVVGVQHATRELFSAGQIEVDGDQGKVHVLEALHKSHSAREAGGSIKPGAQAPGSDHKRQAGARETGDSVKFSVFRPLSRALAFLFGTLTWGLRPRLYAYACYRRLRNRFRLFVQNLSSIKLIYAYWRERYSIGVFLPFAILIAAAGAAASGSLPTVRDALIGCVLAYTLVLVFRIGDDLADLSSDRLRHPGRVLVRTATVTPIIVFALVIAAGDILLMLRQPQPGARLAVFFATSLFLWLWYHWRTRLRVGPLASAHVVLVKYPVISLLTCAHWDKLSQHTALPAFGAIYLGLCIYEQVHDRVVRESRGAAWIFAAEVVLLAGLPLLMLSTGGLLR